MTPSAIALTLAAAVVVGLLLARSLGLRAWIEARATGVPIGFGEILGMKLRRTDARAVVRAALLARRDGLEIDRTQLEAHALAGGRPERLVAAMIEAERRGLGYTIEELATAELSYRP